MKFTAWVTTTLYSLPDIFGVITPLQIADTIVGSIII